MFIDFLVTAILSDVRCYLTVVLICLSLIISNVEHLFMCLLASSMSTLEKWLFRASTHFSFLFLFFFFEWLHPWHMEVLGPETESEPQLQPIPQLWQHLIIQPTVPGQGLNSCLHSDPSCCSQILNLLNHSGNSLCIFFFFLAAQWHREFPGQGSDLSCSYELNHSWDNTRSLTHCARLGIKLAFQCSSDAADPVVP